MIIDAHQHFWDVDSPRGSNPDDHRILGAAEGITGTILRASEKEGALALAEGEPLIVGVCGTIDGGPGFGAELEKLSANPLFRGICRLGRDIEQVDAALLSDLEHLSAKDRQLDLLRVCPGFFGGPKAMQALYQGTPTSFEATLTIARSLPGLRVVVEHIGGMPIDGGTPPVEWQQMYRQMAQLPNISIKVSGLMSRAATRSPGERATEAYGFYVPALDLLWNTFGEDRLIYGSDWPVCEHVGDTIGNGVRIVRRYFAAKGEAASRKFFWKNSRDVYKWEPRLPSHRWD
ncbi:MAG: amidohydrolase family protein [Pseudomonadota bacterium]